MMSAETLAYRNGVVKVNADSQFLILRHRQCKSAGERAPATEEEEIQYQGLKEHGQRRWQREAEYLSAAEITGLISYRCCNCSRYENAREEEKLRRKPEDFIDVVAELLHLIFISYKPTILSLLLIT
ncbi:hypothetical protein LR48_Vigan01g063000 [Vigna angularis]|uniref:Uncharacterized protein n=1 Tax=Phaseolus angularis TaxID=3914 RepID=A0A0L9TKJ6_PHAAN|nr:hypothetical protein LR48_Vigan01g063000 [Vigna angularis]